jgi:predicted secreted protein
MTSDEFVQFMKGIAIGVDNTPDANQWKIILKKLMDVEKPCRGDGREMLQELKKEVNKGYEQFRKSFPGAPPNIFM